MYTTKSEIENYLQTTIAVSLSSQVSSWIASATRWIDNYTGRNFEAVRAIKKYDGEGEHCLDVMDLTSVNSIWFVSNNATGDAGSRQLTTHDYFLYGDIEDDPTRAPYTEIELNRYGSQYHFPRGQQNIWIDGVWGYSATVPDDIKLVATKLVASMINPGKNDNIKSFSEGDLSITRDSFSSVINADMSIKEILNWYKKPVSLNGISVKRS